MKKKTGKDCEYNKNFEISHYGMIHVERRCSITELPCLFRYEQDEKYKRDCPFYLGAKDREREEMKK